MRKEQTLATAPHVKDVDTLELVSGGVIAFMLGKDAGVTRRVVEGVLDKNKSIIVHFQTKGDANEAIDGTLYTENSY